MTKPQRKTRAIKAKSNKAPAQRSNMHRMYDTARHQPIMDGNRVSHRQVVMNLEAAATYASSIHPTNTTLFPWLAAIAGNFEEYRFNHLRFEFVGYAATTTGGPIVMAIDLDANDAIPDTVAGMNTQSVAKQGSAWDNFHVALPGTARRWRLTDFASPAAATNASSANLVSCGNWLAVTDTTATAGTAIGFLAVDYEIEFRHPTASIPATMAGEGGRVNEIVVTGLAGAPTIELTNDALDASMNMVIDSGSANQDVTVSSQSMAQTIYSWFSGGFTPGGASTTDCAAIPVDGSCEAHELAYAQGRSDNSVTTQGVLAQIVPTLNAASKFVSGAIDLVDLIQSFGSSVDHNFTFTAFEGANAGISWYAAPLTWSKFRAKFGLDRFAAVVTVQTVARMHVCLRAAATKQRDAAIVVRPTASHKEPVVGVHKDGKFAYSKLQLGAMCPVPTLQASDCMHDAELFHKAWTNSVPESPPTL